MPASMGGITTPEPAPAATPNITPRAPEVWRFFFFGGARPADTASGRFNPRQSHPPFMSCPFAGIRGPRTPGAMESLEILAK
jgi:hypothetical protein